jgi:large conductance mechanosensitive channel
MLKDFKQFILRGNVIDLATAVAVGGAFTAIVNSLVKDLITPLVGAVYGKNTLQTAYFTFHKSTFLYGDFINAIITFIIISCVIFFLIIRPINKLMTLTQRHKEKPASKTRTCPECLSDIPKAAHRCMYCTAKVTPVE